MILLNIMVSLLVGSVYAVEGQFSYRGQYTVTGSTRYETVYPSSPAGKVRLEALRADGYACQPKMQFVQCKKVFPGLATLPESLNSVSSPVQNATFEPVQAMSLISQGDDVAIYEAAQAATVDGTSYSMVKYIERTDMVKASVGDPNAQEGYYSFLIFPDFIAILDTASVTESKWAFQAYDIQYFLQK